MRNVQIAVFKLVCLMGLCASLALGQVRPGADCAPLSNDIRQVIENYLAKRLVSANEVKPSVKSVEDVPDSCYRRITLTVPGRTNGDLVMYLSPDERFLTSTLYDLSLDPEKEVVRIAENVAKLLMRDESPAFVGSAARITVVEFVDFECPFCKRFAEWYAALPAPLRDQTSLVFKNLPLAQHPWARSGAAYAACANLQSILAFREVTDFFFQHQLDITPKNLKEKVASGLKESHSVDVQQLELCASGERTTEIIERDIAIAKQLNISHTPTVFIDGRRVLDVASAEELQRLLENELARIKQAQTIQVSAKP